MNEETTWRLAQFGWTRRLLGLLGLVRNEMPILDHLSLEGLERPVDIHWNAQDIPSIEAQSIEDAIFAQGYLHGRMRAFQMDLFRRMPAGELAEILGPAALANDTFMRRLNLAHWAHVCIQASSPRTQTLLQQYADGINQALSHSPQAPEHRMLKVRMRPWTVVDSALVAYSLAWPLNIIWHYKWAYDRYSQNPAVRSWLFDPLPNLPDRTIIPNTGQPGQWGIGGNGIGSNNWVVNGTRTKSGDPLLANDPHLAPLLPSIWYQIALKGGDLDARGVSLPGVPAIIIGQNRRIAWGVTNVDPDCQDLYRITMQDDSHYLLDGALQTIAVREEVIHVRGRADLTLVAEDTHAGPVIHREPDGSRIALGWTGFSPVTSMDTIVNLDLASSWNDFTRALKSWTIPAQNFVYADVDGHIGYVLAGSIPTRESGPIFGCADGNTRGSLWTGTIAWESMPRLLDPDCGYIVTANNAPVGDRYVPQWVSHNSPGSRAERIAALIDETSKHSLESFARIELDTLSVPLLHLNQKLLADPALPPQWHSQLANFDGHVTAEIVAPTLLYLWAMEVVPADVRDALAQPFFFDVSPQAPGTHPFPENFWALMGERLIPAVSAQFDTLDRTPAYHQAEHRGRQFFGDPMDNWVWGRAHQMVLFHPFIQSKLARPVFGRRSIAVAGDFFTPKQAAFAVDPNLPWPRSVAYLPSYRQILMPGRPDESKFVHLTGQSGHPLSAHYDDLITPYQNGQLFTWGERVRTTQVTPIHHSSV